MTLCEFVMDIAEEEARRRLNIKLVEMISDLSDEIIATAEEYEPIAACE